ncbi:MAG: cyclic nucleotide-binding domain-containing protein [Oscillospiraceae bacterium]|nr:cyclic nucleotide-binding domain-containing protein [Oscillospiraceae bacterium]
MRKVVVIPTYWSREKKDGWREGDAVYDHPTALDDEDTLQRTLESMKILTSKDFKLVLLVCPTTPEIEDRAEARVVEIVKKAGLNAETYIFTPTDLRKMAEVFKESNATHNALSLLTMNGYSNVRNICLLTSDVLAADAAILIDDDEVFEKRDFIERSTEFLGKRVYGDIVYGMAGYYLNKNDQYYDDVKPEAWMTYWDRFGAKARAFDEFIGCSPRIKRTPFAFGGAMILHRDMFRCVPFDPHITRGEDIDYVINSRMYGFSFFLDNTLSIKHLPVPKKHPQWKRIREDIYRFVYAYSKIQSQYKTSNMVTVSAEDFDPYPGEFLRSDLQEKIFRSNTMLALQYMQDGDAEGCREALNNISFGKKDAQPTFDTFSRYRANQKSWEQLTFIISEHRYRLRKIMEEHNLTKKPILRNAVNERDLNDVDIAANVKKAFNIDVSSAELAKIKDYFFVKTFYEGETVFKEGDFNDTLYVILKGEIVIINKSDTGSEGEGTEIARLKQGDILGESCLSFKTFLSGGRAEQFTELIGIKEENLRKITKTEPAAGVKIYQRVLAGTVGKLRTENRQKTQAYDNAVKESLFEGTE